ncbi:hypothetical protein ACFL59_12700 [Planctomycetota bacterium]
MDKAHTRSTLTLDRRAGRFYVAVVSLAALLIALFCVQSVIAYRIAGSTAHQDLAPWLVAFSGASFLLLVASLVLAVHATFHVHRVLGAARGIAERLRSTRESWSGVTTEATTISVRRNDALHAVAAEINSLIERAAEHSAGLPSPGPHSPGPHSSGPHSSGRAETRTRRGSSTGSETPRQGSTVIPDTLAMGEAEESLEALCAGSGRFRT